jgi:hypothetical protein
MAYPGPFDKASHLNIYDSFPLPTASCILFDRAF